MKVFKAKVYTSGSESLLACLRGGGSRLGFAFLGQAMLLVRDEHPMGHTQGCVCETASTFGRDQPRPCNSRRKALVGEVILWQVGCTSPFRPPTVLSTPSFAYNHQEALLLRSKAAHALSRGSRGPFWPCPLQISMQINK